jgi:hypothetical protein
MLLDRPLNFTDADLNFGNFQSPAPVVVGPASSSGNPSSTTIPRGRFPF